ncbi:MAG: hypothetical protein IJ329_00125 [Clostridia bacterium]|nr:hypothetical protein [Clostridia bacterium]
MKHWRKALTCGLMGIAAVCFSVFGVVLQPANALDGGITYTGNDFYWQKVDGVANDSTTSTMYVNSPKETSEGGWKAVGRSAAIGGNSTIEISITGNITKGYDTNGVEQTYWGYNWIIFQDTSELFANTSDNMLTSAEWTPRRVRDTDGDEKSDMPANSAGNWLAIAFGSSEGGVNLYECDSGVVTKKATIATENYSTYQKTATIVISTTDTATGVTLAIDYIVDSTTYTYVHTSENNALWGEQTFTIGYLGNATCASGSSGETFTYTANVISASSSNVYKSYNALAESDWVKTTNIETTGSALRVKAPSRPTGTTDVFESYAETGQVGGNSTIDLTMTGTIKRGTDWEADEPLWAYDWILFKNTNKNSGCEWHPAKLNSYQAGENENWIAFAFGASVASVDKENGVPAGAALYECNNGVITPVAIHSEDWKGTASAEGYMSGYDVWYTYAQTTHIKITTKDTDTGVFVKLTYYACDYKGGEGITQTGYVYEYTYVSTNTNLWGDQSYVIGHYGNGAFNDTENYSYDIRIMNSPSTKTNNVAGDPDQWALQESVNATNVTFLGDDGMRFGSETTTTAMMLKKNVKADSTMTFTIYGNSPKSNTTWANMFIVFKNTSETLEADIVQKYIKDGYSNANDNWMALYFGSNFDSDDNGTRDFGLYECKNGELSFTDYTGCAPYWVSGYACWYLGDNQTTNITIVTEDTDTGVEVSIAYTASGCTHANTVNTDGTSERYEYNISYTSDNTALRGDYGVSVGCYAQMNDSEYIDLKNMAVYEKGIDQTAVGATKSGMYVQDVRGASLSMDGDVAVNFYVALAPIVWKDAEAQVDIYMDNQLYASSFLEDIEKDALTNYYRVSCGVPPKDYQKTLRVVLSLRENRYVIYEGQVITKYIDSAKTTYGSATDEAGKATYNAVLALEDYCKAAREYFSPDEVTEEEKVADTDVDVSGVTESAPMEYTVWNTDNEDMSYKDFAFNSVTLVLETETTFRLYVYTNKIEKYNVSLYMGTPPETLIDEFITQSEAQAWQHADWIESKDGYSYYYVEISGIAVSDLDKKFAITVENKVDFSRCTYTCSVYNYMRTVFKKNTDAALVKLLKYMYVYHQQATAYNVANA